MATPLLELRDVTMHFPAGRERVHALNGVSLVVNRSETLGLVGESGCGKTTLGRIALGLLRPSTGDVLFDGQSLVPRSGRARQQLCQRIQIVFQDPFSSLDPRMRAGDIVGEGLRTHRMCGGSEGRAHRVAELMELVGLDPALSDHFPHEFSGGQRQRLCIARALAVGPELIVCDEAVSALDVSVQAQILNLLAELQADMGLAYLFISHDLSVVRYLSDRVAAMYLGAIVEVAPADSLYAEPLHPYTRALLSAVPTIDEVSGRGRIVLEGDVPSPTHPPPGCPFHPRCPERLPDGPEGPSPCDRLSPRLSEHRAGHWVACFRYQDPDWGGAGAEAVRWTSPS